MVNKLKMHIGEYFVGKEELIENLMIDQKLNPGVVNVLIDYVLKTNNKKLNKDFIETIAGQWKRLNIETVNEAMEVCRKEHKRVQKNIVKNVKIDKKDELGKFLNGKGA